MVCGENQCRGTFGRWPWSFDPEDFRGWRLTPVIRKVELTLPIKAWFSVKNMRIRVVTRILRLYGESP